jgi:hypothetical protein
MACGAIATMALSVVLLGHQQIKVEKLLVSHQKTNYCAPSEPLNANAFIVLRDVHGNAVLRRKVHVAEFIFYENSSGQRGGVPAAKTSFVFNFPRTKRTILAAQVELKFINRHFDHSASLLSRKKPRPLTGLHMAKAD